MNLWDKGNDGTPSQTASFTIGADHEFDLMLAPYDVQGSIAHVTMLNSVGLIDDESYAALKAALESIALDIRNGNFSIPPEAEDVHTHIELLLTERLGEAGKRIHTGRSRNDQIAVDIKLLLKDQLTGIRLQAGELFKLLQLLSERHKDVLLPGYTHTQIAMPSSFGLWFGSWAELMVDDMELLAAAFAIVNKNPLGSAAGYGSSFPLDREMTTALLGFRTMHYNVIAAQMSRGRTEKAVAYALASLASTIARMSADICLYVNEDHRFLSLPDAMTTGSSIMPHKKNPDVFELVRARCNRIQAVPNELTLLLANLGSGYHRDLQLTKEILFPAIQTLNECLGIVLYVLPQMQPNANILEDARYRTLFSVEAVNELVKSGTTFRDAYKRVGTAITEGNYMVMDFDQNTHTLSGSMGNLSNHEIEQEWRVVMNKFG